MSEDTVIKKRFEGGRRPPGNKKPVTPRPSIKKEFVGDCKDLAECVFDCEDSKQSGIFEDNIDQLANYAGTLYGGEVRYLIKNFKHFVVPVPEDLPTSPEPTPSALKIWALKLTAYVKKTGKIEDDCQKLFSLIWGQCTSTMKAKLEGLETFESINDSQDALGLLIQIKGLVFKFDNRKYPPYSNMEATVKLYQFRQGHEMTNSVYFEKFKSMVAVIEHYGGSVAQFPQQVKDELAVITGAPYSKATTYKDEDVAAAEDIAKEKSLACLFLHGADKSRFGELVDGIHNDFVKKIGSFPATLREAYELMNDFKPARANARAVSVLYGTTFTQDAAKSKLACWGCGKAGVSQADCTNQECMAKWKLKQEKKKENQQGTQHLNLCVDGDEEGVNDDEDEFVIDKFVGFSFHQGNDEKVGTGRILLDNQSTHSTFYTRSLVTNIRKATHSIKMLANGGTITYNQIGDLAGYGIVWFNEHGIANIISMSEAESKGHKISYTPGCFQVTNGTSDKITRFYKTPEGLYAHDVGVTGASLVQTVSENEKHFTSRQLARAKEAQLIYEMIGRPSVRDFVAIIKNNLLPNIQITSDDILRAGTVYGKDLGSIQGKTTRSKPLPVAVDYIRVPPDILEHHRDVTIAADIMFVAGIPFFLTTSRNIQFTTVTKLVAQDDEDLIQAILQIVGLYNRRGFEINVCLMDNQFEPLRGALLQKGIELNCCAPGEHVPEIERKIRTVKERIRGTLTVLPFTTLPLVLIIHSVGFAVLWLNFFPPNGGVSPTLSPQAILTGLHADAGKHCRMPFGGYAQVHAEPDPTNDALVSRTVGGICLGPTGNIQGTHKFMSLLTGRLIQARSFTPLPMPEEVIQRVNTISKNGRNEVIFEDRNGDAFQEAWEEYDDPEVEYIPENAYAFAPQDDIPLQGAPLDANELADLLADPENEGVDNDNDVDHDHEDEGGVDIQNEGVDNSEEETTEEEGVDTDAEPEENLVDESGNPPAAEADTPDRTHTVTRSGRAVRIGRDLTESYVLTQREHISPSQYTPTVARTFGIKSTVPHMESTTNDMILQYAFTQYSLKQGLKKFPKEAMEATVKEMTQLHDMSVFKPVTKASLTGQEIAHTLGSIIFIKQKRCGRIKARACADGRPQKLLYDKADSASPTVKTESVILTSVIDAAEEREVAVYDIPGAFLHSKLPDVVHMKVVGELADMLVQVKPDLYEKFVTDEKGKKVIYLLLTRSLYGCVKSAIQFWKHLSGNLLSNGYILNPHDSCVANKEIEGSQFTVIWHVDDLKLSHKSSKVIDKEVEWLETIYGPLVGTRGRNHAYLGMDLEFGSDKSLKISMVPYFQEIIDEFPEEIGKPATTPASVFLFEESENPIPLNEKRAKVFHHSVARLLWGSMRARPDLLTALSFLTSKVQTPDEDDNKKLIRVLSYLKGTIDLPLRLSADGSHVVKWWVDASFATRKEMRSQTGAVMSMGNGGVYCMSRKQGLTTKSSTEAELVGADDILPQMIWTRSFLLSQGVKVSENILYQDNKSAILLETNGLGSSSRRTRHINIRFYFIKDRVSADELKIQYCPTDQMIGDFFTKPLQGTKFIYFRRMIMGEEVL